ncbi:MAG: hypothetical protein AAF098_19970 [Pseudomonadota bacterium]
MTTSAQSLNQLFAAATNSTDKQQKVVTVVASHLGLTGDDAEAIAIYHIHKLLRRISNDIDNLPIDDVSKKQARNYLGKFQPLTNFNGFHMSVNDAVNNYMKADHLVGLINLHMAISGHVEYINAGSDITKHSDTLRSLIDDIEHEDISDFAKRVLRKRLIQLRSIIDNFDVYSPEELAEALEALVGSIIINQPKAPQSAAKTYAKIVVVTGALLAALAGISQGLGSLVSITESSQKLLGVIDGTEEQSEHGDTSLKPEADNRVIDGD